MDHFCKRFGNSYCSEDDEEEERKENRRTCSSPAEEGEEVVLQEQINNQTCSSTAEEEEKVEDEITEKNPGKPLVDKQQAVLVIARNDLTNMKADDFRKQCILRHI
eukprot:Nk52_evm17s1737 gene=Nk52_evmTU17s1737